MVLTKISKNSRPNPILPIQKIWVLTLNFYEGWIIVIEIILIESTLNVLDTIQILSMDEKCPKINPK